MEESSSKSPFVDAEKREEERRTVSGIGRKRRRRQLLLTDFLYDVFAFLSVLDIVETGLNTVSRLAFRIAKQSNRAFRAVWTKPARMVPDMEIWMYSSNPTPIVRIGHNGPGQVELALPNMSPSKRDILGFGDVRVTFVDKEDDTPEKNHPRLEKVLQFFAHCSPHFSGSHELSLNTSLTPPPPLNADDQTKANLCEDFFGQLASIHPRLVTFMYLDPSQCSDWLKQAPPVVRSTANLQALIHLPRTKQDALVPAQQRLATLIEDCFDWAVIANNNNNNNDVMRGTSTTPERRTVFLNVAFNDCVHPPPLAAEGGATAAGSVEVEECYCKRTVRVTLEKVLSSLEKRLVREAATSTSAAESVPAPFSVHVVFSARCFASDGFALSPTNEYWENGQTGAQTRLRVYTHPGRPQHHYGRVVLVAFGEPKTSTNNTDVPSAYCRWFRDSERPLPLPLVSEIFGWDTNEGPFIHVRNELA